MQITTEYSNIKLSTDDFNLPHGYPLWLYMILIWKCYSLQFLMLQKLKWWSQQFDTKTNRNKVPIKKTYGPYSFAHVWNEFQDVFNESLTVSPHYICWPRSYRYNEWIFSHQSLSQSSNKTQPTRLGTVIFVQYLSRKWVWNCQTRSI